MSDTKRSGGLTNAQRTRIKWAIPISIVLWAVIMIGAKACLG